MRSLTYTSKCSLHVLTGPDICKGPFSSFEFLAFVIDGTLTVFCLLVYSPPEPNIDFISEFSDLLSHIALIYVNILILGDFNIHVDCCKSRSHYFSGVSRYN